ncbi:Nucleotidyltransferase [Coprinopsis marcescibilis]|uniref:DNA-directed DNA polymerase n=1 Tax=Coprinopsis marcescibilis TaxID=230819 RepID=A0A5C3KRU4_COPMA|nr:Nucleotidyltransferase [Coprinopsis marcescibilis]
MPSKRPAARSHSHSPSLNDARPNKRSRTSFSPSPSESGQAEDSEHPLHVFVVQEKLTPEVISQLHCLIERFSQRDGGEPALQLVSNVSDADVIITAIHMRRRLERHVPWELAKQKALVTPSWLRDSVKAGHLHPCGDYAAIKELHEETVDHCPEGYGSKSHSHHLSYLDAPPTVRPTDTAVFSQWRARYACERASPLFCPNQELADALSVLCRDRELEGLNVNALAYQRAVAIIKSYPNPITNENIHEVSKLPGLGEKIFFKVEEFVEKGYIPEVQGTLASQRYQSLSCFASVYGIGSTKARQFYDMGLRTISDLERYYDITPVSVTEASSSATSIQGVEQLLKPLEEKEQEAIYTPNGKRVPDKFFSKSKQRQVGAPDISIPIGIALRTEFDTPIPRAEVEEIRDVVMGELHHLQPGCVSTIVGGYRRGKPQSNDVDIVISHSDLQHGADAIKGLCNQLAASLYRKGIITHLMHLSGFHAYNALRAEHWDSLEKALSVFRLPSSHDGKQRLHRRVDLIFAAPASYWTAVIGWTGSKMFQRDLRLWAKQEKGMKFDSNGLTRRHDSRLFLPKSEEEVFKILGLKWIDPTMRNADA